MATDDTVVLDAPQQGPSPAWSRQTKFTVAMGLVAAILFGVWLARGVVPIAAFAGLVAFLVAPAIRWMSERLHLPRPLALLVTYAVVLFVLLVIGFLVAKAVAGSIDEIRPDETWDSLRRTVLDWLTGIRHVSILGLDIDLSQVVDPIRENLSGRSGGKIGLTGGQANDLVGGVLDPLLRLSRLVTTPIFAGLVILLAAVYLNAESGRYYTAISGRIPPDYADDVARLSHRYGRIWKGYIYGQLVNSITLGILIWLVLWLLGVKGAFLLGLILAVLNMIPTFGPVFAAIPAVLIALATGSTRLGLSHLLFALVVAVVYIVVVQLHSNLMAPLITGKAVHMSPAVIMLGLLVGFELAGLVGAILVVPVLATLKESGRYAIAKLLDEDPFAGEREPPPGPTVEVAEADAGQ